MKLKQWKLYSSIFLIIGTILFTSNKGVSEDNCIRNSNEIQNLLIEGDDFEKQQKYDKAREKYIEALRCDSYSKQYYERLFEDPYKDVRVLENNGFYEEAKKKLSEIVQKQPTKEIPAGLKYLSGTDLSKNANYIRDIIFPCLTDLLLFVAILLFFFFMIIRLPIIWEIIIGFFKSILRILINVFNKKFSDVFKKKFYLEIKDFNDEAITLKIGKATTAMFKKALVKSGEIGEKPTVDVAFEPIGKFEPPIDLSKTAAPLGILFNFFQSLFPIQSYTLSGYCEESEEQGLGLTLVLKSSRNEVETEVFWQKAYDPEMSIKKEAEKISRLLAKPAAIWILFKLDSNAAKKWLGVKNWESYAYSRVGGDWVANGNSTNATKILHKSLLYDSENRFAIFNLGTLEIKENIDSKNFSSSTKFFNKSKEISEKLGTIFHFHLSCQKPYIFKKNYTDVIWYKSMYQLAVIDEYNFIAQPQPQPNIELPKIQDLTDCLKFLHNQDSYGFIKPMCDILHASMLVRSDKCNDHKEAEKIIEDITKKYRMASVEDIEDTEKIITIDDQGNLSLTVSVGNPHQTSSQAVLPVRAYYNLACYHAACAEKKANKNSLDKSLRYLKYAVKNEQSLAKWAKTDPSFKSMRKDHLDRFNEAIHSSVASQPDYDPLMLIICRMITSMF